MNPPYQTIQTPNVAPAFQDISNFIVGLIPILLSFFKSFLGFIIGISIPLSIVFFIIIIYCVEQLKRIRNKEAEKFDIKVVPAYEPTSEHANVAMAKRWDNVKKHIDSQNENDWRQAIMEADIILDELLSKMGYRGETVGEKLKRVEKGDFVTLDDAWEAHKVRNQIAHEGTNFVMNHHEAKHTIDRYRRVFDEFFYI